MELQTFFSRTELCWISKEEEEEDDESQTIWNGNDFKLIEYRKKVPFGSGCRAGERIANVIQDNSNSEIVEEITCSIPLG